MNGRQQCPWPESLLRRLRFMPPGPLATGCIEFTGYIAKHGYGNVSIGQGRIGYSHRAAFELIRGPIPAGLFLDHLCRNTICCNPGHLEPVTPRENVLRGQSPSARAVRENRCRRGHEFTPENTYVRPDGSGKRQCRKCRALAVLRHAAKRRSIK